jgi:2,3-bisphosphoglycerate-independent phosphoglycerate mutase
MTDALHRTSLLIVLDGWGYSDSPVDNAIAAGVTPTWDGLWQNAPHTLVSGSGVDVGLPAGQMGNSEVGHMNLGAGRVVYQDLTRISRAIESDEFSQNPVLIDALKKVKRGNCLHVMGLVSPGGVHSHEDQILALIELAAEKGLQEVHLHAFLDGRDTPPRSARDSLARADDLLKRRGVGRVASITGRYYAMDRDNRWDRIERAYNLLQRGEAPFHAETAVTALDAAYARDEGDEFVQPTAIHDADALPVRIDDGDVVVFMNFRADRARQLTRAFTSDDFDSFERRSRAQLAQFVMLTQYAEDIDAPCAYPPEMLHNTFGEYLSGLGKTQLRIAETEKYAHVTFFFSGGRERPFAGEQRELIESPKVATYDLQPEMSAIEVTDKLIEALESAQFDAIICNFANADMVGHTGIFDAAVKAVETLDCCLTRIVGAVQATGADCLITADHGNVERMKDAGSGQPHTAHTVEPVPLVYVGRQNLTLAAGGTLSDVAPTLLALMGLPIPDEMTGHSLANPAGEPTRRSA